MGTQIQNYYMRAEPKYEYPPNNSTTQNIELHNQRKLLASKNMSMSTSMYENSMEYMNNSSINMNRYYNNENKNEIKENNIIEENMKEENRIMEENKKKGIEEEIEDPDEIMFKEKEKEKEKSKKEDGSELSEDTEKHSDNEKEYNDNLYAQYEKVKRVKNKWKVKLKGCIVQKDNKEYICGDIHGELEREW